VSINLDKILYRILLGYYYITIDNIEYKIIYPSLDIKYRAEIIYDKVIEENKFDKRFLTQNEISNYLRINNIWKSSDDELITKYKKTLDDLKVDLYLNYSNEKTRTKIKQSINRTNNELNNLLTNKNSMNYLGINDHAISIKNEYMIMNSIYDLNGSLVFNNPEKESYEYKRLQKFIREILENNLDVQTLKNLAKSDTWKSLVPCIDLTVDPAKVNDDYKYLIGLHKMYDSVRQHPECPSDEILNDDDALDGWFIHNNKKAEKEKKKNSVLSKVRGNIKNAGEVFIITDDAKEVEEIHDLNDIGTKKNIQEMISLANKDPGNKDHSISWGEIPFVQRGLKQQLQKISDNRKPGR